MKPEQVVIVAHDAGGAEVLSSYVRRLDRAAQSRYVFVLDGPARRIFSTKLGQVRQLPLDVALQQSSSVLCGSGWQSDLEVRAIALASRQLKHSTVFLDHWVNYRERFMRDGETHLPDEIWVGDAIALDRARTALPGLPISLVENPYFLDIRDEFRRRPPMKAGPDGVSVLFVCEPIREHALRQHGDERHWGYTEEEALRYFLDHVDALQQPIARILVRPHPAELPDKYSALIGSYDLPVHLSSGRDLLDEVADSQWVAGCNSMAMVVGLLAGRQIVCCIPPGGRPCLLPQPDIRHLQILTKSLARDS
jgi:hypothetical protein